MKGLGTTLGISYHAVLCCGIRSMYQETLFLSSKFHTRCLVSCLVVNGLDSLSLVAWCTVRWSLASSIASQGNHSLPHSRHSKFTISQLPISVQFGNVRAETFSLDINLPHCSMYNACLFSLLVYYATEFDFSLGGLDMDQIVCKHAVVMPPPKESLS